MTSKVQLSASDEARRVIVRAWDMIDLLQRLIRAIVNDSSNAKRIAAHLSAAHATVERALSIIDDERDRRGQ